MTRKIGYGSLLFIAACGNNGVTVGDMSGGTAGAAGVAGATTGGAGSAGSSGGGGTPSSGGSASGSGGAGGSVAGTTGGAGAAGAVSAGAGGGGAGSGGSAGACATPLPGSFPGCECWTDEDCAVGARCYSANCATATVGSCAAPPPDGCFGNRDCPTDQQCNGGQPAPCGTTIADVIGTCTSDPCPVAAPCTGGNGCQCFDSGTGQCTVADGPQNNGICRGSDGVCFLCECASADTPIATPTGDRLISELSVGDLIYSVDGAQIRPVPVLAVNRIAVTHHRVLRIVFENGDAIEMSPNHPTADGRRLVELVPGSQLMGGIVASVTSMPYRFTHTYDILADSSSGAYFASGVLIGSTLLGSGSDRLGQ